MKMKINGKIFPRMYDAAKYLGIAVCRLSILMNGKRDIQYKDYHIEKIGEINESGNIRPYHKKGAAIVLLNTGKVFSSMSEAAEYAGTDPWTIKNATVRKGIYIDKNGNQYKRVEPIKRHKKHFHNVDKKPEQKEVQDAGFVFADLPKAVQELINEKISEMLEQNKPWSEIKVFLKKMGCKKLTIRVTDDAE